MQQNVLMIFDKLPIFIGVVADKTVDNSANSLSF